MEPGFKESRTPEKEPEIINPEIALLEKPMKKILREMSKNINKGEYSVILGEDASGRLPALLFNQILTTLYKDKNLPSPEIRFFAGQLFGDQAQEGKAVKYFKNFIEMGSEMGGLKEKIAENKKFLVVTDTIDTGKHLLPFAEILRDLKISFDVSTIGLLPRSIKEPEQQKKSLENLLGAKVFWGHIGTPHIHSFRSLAGVVRSDKPAPFAQIYRPSINQKEVKGGKSYYPKISETARQDIKILGEKLAQWYKENLKKDK